MCRWLAYRGPAIPLDLVLVQPRHSLIDQSLNAEQNVGPDGERITTNGDGFGMGWYRQGHRTPGRYRSVRPAWNDPNLLDLAHHVESPLFLAHVRASTGTPVQQSNCHPFRHAEWLFQHNGGIDRFDEVKRDLTFEVAEELYPEIEGSTDSELLFYLALTYGLRDDPAEGLRRMVHTVEEVRRRRGVDDGAFDLTCVTTDGSSLWAVRYSSTESPKTLYVSSARRAMEAAEDGRSVDFPHGGVIVVSEPLDSEADCWQEIPPASILTVRSGERAIDDFTV